MTEIQNPKPVYDLEVRTSQYPAGTEARPTILADSVLVIEYLNL